VEHRRRLIPVLTPAAAFAVLIVAASSIGASVVADGRTQRASASLARRASPAIVALDVAIRDTTASLAAPSALNLQSRRAATPYVPAAAMVTPDGRLSPLERPSPPAAASELTAAIADRDVRLAMDVARDTAQARTVRARAPRPGVVLVVAPVFGTVVAPAAIVERRAALTGFVLAELDVARIAERTVGAVLHPGDAVVLRDGSTVIYRSGPVRDGHDLVVAVPVAGGTWEITASHRPQSGAVPLIVLLSGLFLAAGLAIAGEGVRRARMRALADAAARAGELQLVVDVGALLQQSLELAEILPALTVTVSDQLELDGAALVLADDSGTLVEAFVSGQRPTHLPAHANEVPTPPARVGAGEELVLPLERAGRTVGALWMVPRHGLTETQMRSARAVADLVGSAIVNARSFQREQDTVRRLHEIDQLKTDFLSTVSHELRTPISAINGFSSILDESWDTIDEAQRHDLVSRIARNASSLGAMLSGLLDFARIERRSLQIERSEEDLGRLVSEVVEQTSSLLDDHVVAVDVRPDVIAKVDPHAVERILSNLLTNAAKFSPRGTTIGVEVRRSGSRAVISVSDQGSGVAPEERGRIFSRFYRGATDAATRTRGAGVGLAVVKELVDRLDGTVAVIDAPGGGACFVVSFPAVSAVAVPGGS
jgi:signal transduction histidine kinase